jgi:putative nucleotidyltransferase with HDIG domain/PAS domain S-box-containing protein
MDTDLTLRHFAEMAPQITVAAVRSSQEALQLLAQAQDKPEVQPFDLVLADLRMPDMGALDFCREAKHQGITLPVVIITGKGDEETAVAALRLGAYDYIVKRDNYLTELPYAVENAIVRFQLDQMNRRLQMELEELNQSLEQKVKDRTAELQQEIAERRRAEEALRDSEVRLKEAQVLGRIGNWEFDLDNQTIKWSDQTFKLYERDPALGPPTVEEEAAYYSPEQAARLHEYARLAVQQGQAFEYDLEARLPSGRIAHFTATMRPIKDERGRIVKLFGTVQDITERKQRERELEAIANVSTALRVAQTRADMLPIILDQLLALLKVEGASLTMRDPVSDETVIELGRGAWAKATGSRFPRGEGVFGPVMATGQPYLNNDLASEPRLAQSGLTADLRAVAGVPLIAQGQTIGALWVGRRTPVAGQEVRLLTAIADIAANAIHRATLHEQTEQHVERLAALHAIDMAISGSLDLRVTFNIVLEHVTTQLRVDAADILLLNPYLQTLEYAVGRGFRGSGITRLSLRLGENYAGKAALERRTIAIPDLRLPSADWEPGQATVQSRKSEIENLKDEGFIAYYGVPLIAKGQVKGVLELFHRAPLSPDPEWLEFLEMLARQAAIAIDNTELFNGLQRSNAELVLSYDTTLEGWSRALELRDRETEGHTQRVTEMTLRLARALGMSDKELSHARRGALLHDIGKMGVTDAILLKPGPLTDEEWDIMRQHPQFAYEMLSPIAYLRPALDIPYCHHEKWDGTGYPRGLKGEEIPLAARIFAVVDVWDALRSDRPYRPAWPKEKALEHIRAGSGTHFDPKVVEAFLEMTEGGRG